MSERRFVAIFDLHWGYETKGGHKRALHDLRAWSAVRKFISDFKPHDIVLGGDILDCGAISHHNKLKPRKTEGFRLLKDAEEASHEVIKPLESSLAGAGTLTYITGNHEDWIEDLLDEDPALEGVVSLRHLLALDRRWDVLPQGGVAHLGKLYFVHGDQIRGGEHVAKSAVLQFERNIRFGHFHTYQAYTKTSAVDLHPKSGVCVPCLCGPDAAYNEGKPNRHAQGFLWGYRFPDGNFSDYVSVINKGSFHVGGRRYIGE